MRSSVRAAALGAATGAAMNLFASCAAAQTTTSTILRVPGKTIELLGLTRWTPAMIQDSMDVHSPGDSLTSHACAAALRYRLGFAEAASFDTRIPGDSTPYAVVAVIEPQDAGLLRHRPLPLDTLRSRAPWPPLLAFTPRNEDVLFAAVRARIEARAAKRAPVMPSSDVTTAADSAAVREVWAYLDDHSTAKDAATARRLLADAPSVRDRAVALAVMSSFDRDDASWWALAATLREQDGWPKIYAGEILRAWGRAAPRRVNWTPAAADLHAVLNGANLWVLDQVLEALVATGIGPQLAAPLLKDGGHAVLMFAGAAHPRFREPARRFLRTVSGRDYGDDLSAWKAWVDRL